MSSLQDVKRSMLNHIATLYSADKSLPDLAARAEAFAAQAQRHETIQAGIDELEGGIDPLAAELESLKQPYLDALWDLDTKEQRRLQTEKKRIEGELTAIQKAVATERKKLAADPVDMEELAELKATLDSFKLPNAWDFTRSLTAPLQTVERDLTARVGAIGRSLQGLDHDRAAYHDHRLEHDHAYKLLKDSAADEELVSQARTAQKVKEWKRVEASNQREETIAAGAVGDRVS